MKPSDASCDIPDLDLPVDRQVHALAPRLSLKEYCRLNHQFRGLFPKGIPTEEERLARKLSEEFVL
jgi:hypothetical protein